jgi:hypothetical protein
MTSRTLDLRMVSILRRYARAVRQSPAERPARTGPKSLPDSGNGWEAGGLLTVGRFVLLESEHQAEGRDRIRIDAMSIAGTVNNSIMADRVDVLSALRRS